MITTHESFPPPPNRQISVWRYMNLSKLVWMLQKKALFFSRSDLMGDPYEGYYPRNITANQDEFIREVLHQTKNMTPEFESGMRTALKSMLAFAKNARS